MSRDMSTSRKTPVNWLLISFWMIGALSFIIRAYVNFSQELLIGNGGYYPLQVRTVLERGELAFPDMPLLFYLDAGIVRLISMFDIPVSNELIMNVVMTVDSVSVPLLLIPLYQLFKLTKNTRFSYSIASITVFAVLSFYTLNLISTSQKNSLAITLLFFTISSLIAYLNTNKRKSLILSIVFFVLVGLTHFGTFSFSLLFGAIFLMFRYKKKAFIPLAILLVSALLLVYVFDPTRSERLLFAWQELFSISPNPPQLVQMLAYLTFAIVAIFGFRKFKDSFNDSERTIIFTLITILVIIPLPVIDPQYTSRLSVFLFIPLVLLILIFNTVISSRSKRTISILVGIISLASIGFVLSKNGPIDVSGNALTDMENMKPYISNSNETVVVSRHNLEFWVAWTLHVDVCQESKFDNTLINEYDDILILNQIQKSDSRKRGMHRRGGKGRSHFEEPLIPTNATLVYSSEHFKLYRYNTMN